MTLLYYCWVFTMVTAKLFLRVFLCAVVTLDVHGFPTKGSQFQGQSSSGSYGGGNFAPNQGAATGYYTPTYSAFSDVPRPGPLVRPAPSSSQVVQGAPAPGSMSPTPGAGYGSGFGPAPMGIPGGAGPLVPVQAGYPVLPLPAGSDAGSAQAGGPQSSLPETKWTVEPQIFSEEGLANTQALDSSSFAFPSPPSGPVLQSGETSSVVKEAELGNYQHETEEIGYPAGSMGPGQGFASYPMSYVGGGGYWGSPQLYPALHPVSYPYPFFDYRLLYGLYPPGTYTTFSKNHEKGKDYYQSIHYLTEQDSGASDVPSDAGFGRQQKLFPQGS